MPKHSHSFTNNTAFSIALPTCLRPYPATLSCSKNSPEIYIPIQQIFLDDAASTIRSSSTDSVARIRPRNQRYSKLRTPHAHHLRPSSKLPRPPYQTQLRPPSSTPPATSSSILSVAVSKPSASPNAPNYSVPSYPASLFPTGPKSQGRTSNSIP